MYDKVIQNHKNDTIAEKYKYIYISSWEYISIITKNLTTYSYEHKELQRLHHHWRLERDSHGVGSWTLKVLYHFPICNEAGNWSICSWLDLSGQHQLAMWNCESVFRLYQAGGGRHRGRGGRGQELHCRLRRVPRHDDRMMCYHTLPLSKQNKTTGSTCQFF